MSWKDAARPIMFRYELHIANGQHGPGTGVSYEALSFAPGTRLRRLFERRGQAIKVSPDFGIGGQDSLLLTIRPNASVISTLAKLNHETSLQVWQSVGYLMTNVVGLAKWQNSEEALLQYYELNPEVLERLNRLLIRLDLGLDEMIVGQGPSEQYGMFRHQGLDAPLYFNEESQGTRQFVDLFPVLLYVLEAGSVCAIDEIDNDLHPILIPQIFHMFHNSFTNPKNAQLFFTAHNAVLMDDLEKEELFLTDKESTAATRIYGAQDISGFRREPSLTRRYLRGEMGAVPSPG